MGTSGAGEENLRSNGMIAKSKNHEKADACPAEIHFTNWGDSPLDQGS
jgi:hypothetical protein